MVEDVSVNRGIIASLIGLRGMQVFGSYTDRVEKTITFFVDSYLPGVPASAGEFKINYEVP